MAKDLAYFRPRNWHKFQSRSNNSMAWVKVQTSLLSDPDYLSMTEIQRLTWHGLLILFGRIGRPLPLDSRYIGCQLGLDSRGIGKALDRLISNNFIELCDPTQNLHDTVASPREEKIRKEKKDTPPIPPKGGRPKKAKRFESNDPDFEEFWEAYPKGRTGKRETVFRAWRKALEVASAGEIIMGARSYRRSDPGDFVKGAAAWLNDERWRINYDRLRKPTTEEQLQDWINGDQGDDGGSGTIDGDYVEVSGGGPENHSGGVSSGLARPGGRAGNGIGGGPVVELGQGHASQTGGHSGDGERVRDLIAKAAAATKAPTKP